MPLRSEWVWMDGQLVPYDDARVHVNTHTLHYGLGVFEGIRAYAQPDGAAGVFRLDEHLRRLFDSARMCRLTLPFDQEALRRACLDTVRANGLTSAYIRPLVFLGEGQMGLGARRNPVHVVVSVWQWGAYLGDEGMTHGIRCATSTFTRHHPNASLQRAKVVGHYVNSILAKYEANDNGYDEAILLDHSGWVAEGTGENLFVVRDRAVTTPPVQNVLGGITRDTVLRILERQGVTCRERRFGRDALYCADEAFLTGTAAEITPIREYDLRVVGQGTPGPITRAVQATYLAGVRGEVDWMRPMITRVESA